jgi:hypothetical protein
MVVLLESKICSYIKKHAILFINEQFCISFLILYCKQNEMSHIKSNVDKFVLSHQFLSLMLSIKWPDKGN